MEVQTDRPVNAYVIFDTQHRPGLKRNPLKVYAFDIINTLPDYIFHLGDHWDMPSLSSYDKGKHSFSEQCYVADIRSGNQAMFEFWAIIQVGFNRNPHWKPKFVFCYGNHEHRIAKVKDVENSAYLEFFNQTKPDLTNWDHVMPFLHPFILNDVYFAHYFSSEFSDRPIGTARMIIQKRHISAVCGHKQFLDIAEQPSGRSRKMCIINGCSYYEDNHCDLYRGPQNKIHFRGICYLRNLINGEWELECRNLMTLDKKYGQGNA